MTESSLLIRDATEADAEACAAIYAPYVTDTAITFDLESPTPDEVAARIAAAQAAYAWLVAERDGQVIGYASAGRFFERAAYRWACFVGVYLAIDGPRRSGAGRALYSALLDRVADRGYRMAIAAITLPNEPSVRLHEKLGFSVTGTQARIGWKAGSWHDVLWLQKPLGADVDPPAEPY